MLLALGIALIVTFTSGLCLLEFTSRQVLGALLLAAVIPLGLAVWVVVILTIPGHS